MDTDYTAQIIKEGEEAFWDGQKEGANPYKKGFPQWRWWLTGWDNIQLMAWEAEEHQDMLDLQEAENGA